MPATPFPRPLPPGLEPIAELCVDLRWIWNHAADRLWRSVDPELWELTENPWLILQSVSQRRLEELARDPVFLERLGRLHQAGREQLEGESWFDRAFPERRALRVAYFSMEYGLGEALPLYSGGLGVLAGDHLKASSDLGVPVTAVGLLYQEGYFRQMVDADGRQREFYPDIDRSNLPILPARDASGAWLSVALELPGRTLHLRVWRARVGRVDLYLLDGNDPANGPADRGLTAKLYPDDRQTRLAQEMILGIGGWRALEALGLEFDVCHLNEGHAALAGLERARVFGRKHGLGFAEALWAVRGGNLFTTHTPVAAGFDIFAPDLAATYLRGYARELGVTLPELLGLGRNDPRDFAEGFNMAYLSMRACAQTNGVSRLHGEVSRGIFQDLYPRWPRREVPVTWVTNGVHVPSWDSSLADDLWTAACGKERWLGGHEPLTAGIERIDDGALWNFAGAKRRGLVAYARARLARQLRQRGAGPDAVAVAGEVLDPNVLTMGFARRFAEYKRPNLLLSDPERLIRILNDPRRPVQLLVAGKAHPQDERGKSFVRAWVRFIQRPEVRARAVFLEDYDIAVAQKLVQGVDVWLNTPRRPWEACGTSGMKVLANGGLNVSTRDGWWAEAYEPGAGWAIDDGRDPRGADGDEAEAAELYRLIEAEIAPAFYDRDAAGIPRRWTALMRGAVSRLAPRFSSSRMLSDYVRELYLPAADDFRHRTGGAGAAGRALAEWEAALRRHWSGVRFGALDVRREGESWLFRAPVYLGDIDDGMVRVELCADPRADAPAFRAAMSRGEAIPGAANGSIYLAAAPGSRPAEDFTPRVVPYFPGVRVPAELPLVLWQR